MWVNHRKETLGYIFFPSRKTRKYTGKAFDIKIKETESLHPEYSIGEDFNRLSEHEWQMDCDFQFKGKKLFISGRARDSHGNEYVMHGSGDVRGEPEQGVATIFLRGNHKDNLESGFVVYFLRWPNFKKVTGYWVAYDQEKVGRIALGGLNFDLVDHSKITTQ